MMATNNYLVLSLGAVAKMALCSISIVLDTKNYYSSHANMLINGS
jgi:hypothetical protein